MGQSRSKKMKLDSSFIANLSIDKKKIVQMINIIHLLLYFEDMNFNQNLRKFIGRSKKKCR